MLFRAAAAFVALAAAGLLLAPAAQASPMSVQVSGNQLKSALLPASDFGKGLKTQAAVSSGSSLLHRPARGRISSMNCGNFEGSVGLGTFGETAFAVRLIFSATNTDRFYFQSVVQFASTQAAASYYSQAYAKYAKCTDFTETVPPNSGLGSGGTAKFTLHSIAKTSIGGYRAFRVGQSAGLSTAPGISLLANTLVAVAGTDIFYVVSTGLTNVLVPASLMRAQISRVQKLR